MVIKKGGARERFDRNKVLNGLLRACEKRPISRKQLEDVVDRVEKLIEDDPEHEQATSDIGRIILGELKNMDKVAYLRFASVYLEFDNVDQFAGEINDLLEKKQKPKEEG